MSDKIQKTGYIARIHGRVQGVGFRYSARNTALKLGLKGWVRNETDGTVTTEFEGDESACKRFLVWLKTGPPGAYVSDVQSRKTPFEGFYRSFTIEF